MRTSDFDYLLPDELIAQAPMEPRDASRMLALCRKDGSVRHRRFRGLAEFLREGDVLVFNNSRVIPARLHARRSGTGIRVELLLLNRLSPRIWRALVRPGRRMRTGAAFEAAASGGGRGLTGDVLDVEEDGARVVRLSHEDLDQVGVVPLPPYIREPLADAERYQTVYARTEGSVAAPTAGLHFTEESLERMRKLGVETAFVTLHVGWDSFRPVETEDPSGHRMHTEYWELPIDAAAAVNRAKRDGGRVIAIGTTTTRLLEQAALTSGCSSEGETRLEPGSGWADLFILPGYRFRVVDGLLTNFHLPRSTLLMLTCAFGGQGLVMRAYAEAVEMRYRFYSFGDCMLIV